MTEHALEVGLSFSGVPERLLIPFDALTGFFDPSVQFGLKFELQEPPALSAEDAQSDKPGGDVAMLRPAPDSSRTLRGAASEPETAEPAERAGEDEAPLKSGKPSPTKKAAGKSSSKGTGKAAGKTTSKSDDKSTDKDTPADEAATPEDADQNAEDKTSGAEVVSLEAFRKKN